MPFVPHLKDESDETGHPKSKQALLVSVYQGNASEQLCCEHLDELELLCETLGLETVEKRSCHIRKYEASTFVTKGKLEELVDLAEELNVHVVVFDDEISPAQQRNMEKLFKREVVDRTEVILGVFAQRARSKEARLQIELARLRYEAPRLKRLWTHLSRQRTSSGGGYVKGEGEKQIEIDRRILKRKITSLEKEIKGVKAHRDTQRLSRAKSGIPTFALIGYTNVGKSTLLNALTEADVFVEDKLFATLDTTTRKFRLPNNQEILLIDTVGFIRKLPHLLVASFKSTLEEALEADILLHLLDVSHPNVEEQADTTFEVLKELGALEKPVITVLNKTDVCEKSEIINKLRLLYPQTVKVSALKKEGFEELQDAMNLELSKRRRVMNLRIPQSEFAVVSEVMRVGNVISQDYEENDVIIKVDLPASMVGKVKSYEVSV